MSFVCPPCNNSNYNCTYFVQAGDTFNSIAVKLNVNAQQLALENGLPITAQLVVGTQLEIPNCTETRPNNCSSLITRVRTYIDSLPGSIVQGPNFTAIRTYQVTIGYATPVQGDNLEIPVLIVTGGPSLFSGSTLQVESLDRSLYRYEGGNAYSLDLVEDFITAYTPRTLQYPPPQPIRFNCSAALTYQGRDQRMGCTSVYDIFASFVEYGTLNGGGGILTRPSIGVRRGVLVLRITIPIGSPLEFQITQLLQPISSDIEVRRDEVTSYQHTRGSITYSVPYNSFTSYLTSRGVGYCEKRTTPTPPTPPSPTPGDATCQELIEEIRRVIPSGSEADIRLGLIRGRGPQIEEYDPKQYIGGVMVITYRVPIGPLDGRFFQDRVVKGVYLLPLDLESGSSIYELLTPQLTPTQMANSFIYDLTSVAAYAQTDTDFTTQCARDISNTYNPGCITVFSAVDQSISRGPTRGGAAISANAQGFLLRKIIAPTTNIPSWFENAGGSIGVKYSPNNPTVEVNKALTIPLANLLAELKAQNSSFGYTPCTYPVNDTYQGQGSIGGVQGSSFQGVQGSSFQGVQGSSFQGVQGSSTTTVTIDGVSSTCSVVNGSIDYTTCFTSGM